jgi:predicted heme/steroid binding protein/uncharacterized membrane protein
MKDLTPEELALLNGKEGNPACVAVQGKVYDVSASRLWPKGRHMNRHASGNDLTAEISSAPHGTEVLERYPQVGVLVKGAPEELKHLPAFLRSLLQTVPMARRHPHPVLVHFPIAFSIGASLFFILYLVSGNSSYEATSYHLIILAGITAPFAVASGLLTWWINYGLRWTRLIKRKVVLSIIFLLVVLLLVIWRASASDGSPADPFYLVLTVALTPIVFFLGYFGGLMTFPLERE